MITTAPATIGDLPALVNDLDAEARQRFDRLIRVTRATGHLRSPESMHDWIRKLFGSVEAVETQTIVKTTNLVTFEGTLFNALRASRPFESGHSEEVDQVVASGAGDPFCHPLEGTPEDVFGRVRGTHAVTASNVAKYDAFHGVIVFDDTGELLPDGRCIDPHRGPAPHVVLVARAA